MRLKYNRSWIPRFLFCLFVMNYALSFFLPTFAIIIRIENVMDVQYGYDAFMVSFLSVLNPHFLGLIPFISWLANPILWFGVVCFAIGRRTRALCAGLLATAMASIMALLGDKGDNSDLVFSGYYAWLMSMGMFTITVAVTIWESMENSELQE